MSERLLNRAWLASAATREVMAALDRAGIPFRFVGGAVRDSLLGKPVADIDIATPAPPAAVVDALEKGGLKAVPTGIEHGTVTAVARGQPFEITTLRRDVETDGRHAVVSFTDDWREDAARRDFTMNALYADSDGAVTDYFGGADDAKAGHVRFIGDPEQRIREDALRILRFFRFHAVYGRGELDASALAACMRLTGMIDGLSAERVRDELQKTLLAPDPAPVWRAMVDAGVMAHIVPAATRVDDLARMVVLERDLGLPTDPLRRLASAIGPFPEGLAKAIGDRLKLANVKRDHLMKMTASAARVEDAARAAFGRALYGARPESVLGAAMLAHIASARPDVDTLAGFARFVAAWTEPRFPVSGGDLKALGVAEGPKMGRLLADIERWWVAADFKPDRDACLARLAAIRS